MRVRLIYKFRAVGFVDLYVLEKRDLWTCFYEQPQAKLMFMSKGKY